MRPRRIKRNLLSAYAIRLCIVVSLGIPSIAIADLDWVEYAVHWYSLTANWESWIEAEAEAVSAGGHLVTINSAEENAWLAETYRDAYTEGHQGEGPYAAAYIGYYYDSSDAAWKWTSGEPVTYTNLWSEWNYYTGIHAFIATNAHAWAPGGTWNHAYWVTEPGYSDTMGYPLKGIIERDSSPVSVPVVSTSSASDVTKVSAVLNGSIADDGGNVCQYRFRYREEKGDYIYTSWTGSVTTGESFNEPISNLKPNGVYYFNAQARNSAGESEWGDEQTFVAVPDWTPVLKITKVRMVSPTELGIDIDVTFPKDAPEESPRKVNFWATVNGMPVNESFDITRLIQPGQNKQISFDYGSDYIQHVGNTVPPRTINLADKGVPRFDDNVEFTLHGTANWEGGLYSAEATPFVVQIPLPVIIIHGYLYTYKKVLGWFLEQIAPVVYADLKEFLQDHGYADVDHSRYTTMWGMPDIMYRAEELTESALYLKVDGWVTNALQATYTNKVNFIGHSTGGLVARYYAGEASTVNKVISVGTPHLGLTDFYALAFEQSSREKAERILRVPGTHMENLIRWFEPQYPEGSCLVNADTGEPMPELYESTFHPASNSDVDCYSIYAKNRDTPYKLWVRQRDNGWYKVVDPPSGVATTSKGDGYVRAVSSSAGDGPIAIPGEGENSVNAHPTLCEEPWVQEKILQLLRE